MKEKYYCIDCKKEITGTSIRCNSCAQKQVYKDKKEGIYQTRRYDLLLFCIECGKMLGRHKHQGQLRCKGCLKGKNHPSCTHGKGTYQHYCCDCGKKISDRAKRCRQCQGKNCIGRPPQLANNWKGGRSAYWIYIIKDLFLLYFMIFCSYITCFLL